MTSILCCGSNITQLSAGVNIRCRYRGLDLSKEFEVGKKILDGFTFQVDQGERVGLLGKNGAG